MAIFEEKKQQAGWTICFILLMFMLTVAMAAGFAVLPLMF